MTLTQATAPSLAGILSRVDGTYLKNHYVPELNAICNEARELNRFDQYAFFSTLRQAGEVELDRRNGSDSTPVVWENKLGVAAASLPTASLRQLAGHYRTISGMRPDTRQSELIVEASGIITGILDVEVERRTMAGWYTLESSSA